MEAKLKFILRGKTIERTLALNTSLVVGRSSKSDLKLDDEKISSTHCRFHLKREHLEVFDLESRNGTRLNGIKIERAQFFLGDEVRIGDTVITLGEHVDSETTGVLTFPGDKGIQLDFTGARIQNQKNLERDAEMRVQAHRREIALRKKASSRIVLSKEEIRDENKLLNFIALIVDVIGIMVAFSLPLLMMKKMPIEEFRTFIVISTEFVTLLVYAVINFRVLKFSIGEKIAGIENLYKDQ